VKTIEEIRKHLPKIDEMLKEFQRQLELGWGIEVSKRKTGINHTITLFLNKECLEFNIIKEHYKKQRNRANVPAPICVETKKEEMIEEKKQTILSEQKKFETILPIGVMTWTL